MRQHSDGRTIVYGTHDESSQFRDTENKLIRRGTLLCSGEDTIAAIREVCDSLADASENDRWRELAQECIADLPAEVI